MSDPEKKKKILKSKKEEANQEGKDLYREWSSAQMQDEKHLVGEQLHRGQLQTV